MSIIGLRHPAYTNQSSSWRKWRLVYESGDQFIQSYLKHMIHRETHDEFRLRRDITYSPGFAKIGINEIKDRVYLRSKDIVRYEGSSFYQEAVQGRNGGVDRQGSSMSFFICQEILCELLVMSRVGIYTDMPPLSGPTRLDRQNKAPYSYYYPVEDILSWAYNDNQELSALLLRDEKLYSDDTTGLPSGTTILYRHLYLNEEGVVVDLYNDKAERIDSVQLTISAIPFVMPSLSHSIIDDVANYQIALLNIESSDINTILKSNSPFYTEQQDFNGFSPHVKGEDSSQITLGVTKGRRYAKNLERPAFIAPPMDPLKASMEKAKQIKEDISKLINFSIDDLQGDRASGLAYIALVLEYTENEIAKHWAMYEGTESATVVYPTIYSIPNLELRDKEIARDLELADSISSPTYKREIVKRIARLSLSENVPASIINVIEDEVDASEVAFAPYKAIASDLVAGLAALKTASVARGYPEGDVEQAAIDHTERLLRIQRAQTPAELVPNASARGLDDLADNSAGGKIEKNVANDNTTKAVPEDQTRGDGK